MLATENLVVDQLETWYKEWFDREEYEIVYKGRNVEEAKRLIDLLERVVKPDPGSEILDLACGRGRHAHNLARRGYRVTGLDLSGRALDKAEKAARHDNLDIRFVRGDMREPLGVSCFDGVVNLFTAFGYFRDENDNRRAIDSVVTMLRPGGWLLQDYLNAPYVAATLSPEDYRVDDDVEIEQRRWIENNRVNKKIILRRNGNEYTFCESVRLFTLDDFKNLYETSGLRLVETFGDYDGAPYTVGSPRLILHAVKEI